MANSKPVRKESKKMSASIRKSPPIAMKGATKQDIKKKSKQIAKLNNKLERKR